MDDYFQSGMSQVECYTKWKIPQRTLNTWLTSCKSQEKSVSLHSNSKHMDAKDHVHYAYQMMVQSYFAANWWVLFSVEYPVAVVRMVSWYRW